MTDSIWRGTVEVDDAALAVTDRRGPGTAVVYLNGAYASQRHWLPVIEDLGRDWRHVTYDERGRGRSSRSGDYSFAGCLRDVGAVLDARRVERPILVGWSYGAALAVHYAACAPGRVAGVVAVDGAYPYDAFAAGDIDRDGIRRLFRRMRFLLPAARPFGLAGKMSVEQHAEINIEINEVCAAIGPVLDGLTIPVEFVVADGAHRGGEREVMDRVRASLQQVLARNSNVGIGARVSSNHERILKVDHRAVADVVRDVATSARGRRSEPR